MRAVLAAVIALAVSACTAVSRGHPPAGDTTTTRLVIGQGREFNSLLPFMNNGFTTSELIGLAFSLLVTLDPKGYAPDAAATVPTIANGGISADGRTITYHLRHGIRWQDGQPLTARDVLFTQRFAMDPRSPLPYRDGFDRVASLRAPDPYTVIVRLTQPYRLFVVNFLGPESATPILPEHLLAHLDDVVHSAYANAPVGSGPYRIGRWQHGESLSFEASSNWYAGKPAIGRIEIHFIPATATRMTQLRTHEIDAELGASTQTGAQLRGVPGIRVDAEMAPLIFQMSFNLAAPLVSEQPVRAAIAAGIDAQSIARHISHGFFNGRDGARGLYLWAYDAHAGYPTYDPAKAARILASEGWHLGNDGIRHDAAGRRLALTISLRADRADDNDAAVEIQQQLRTLGIDVGLKTYGAVQFTANDGILRRGRFSIALNTYFPNIEPDPTIFFACADRGMNGFNIAAYCDPVTDAAMYASLRSSDPATVRHALSRVQRRLNVALPMIFFWQATDIDIIPTRLHHFSDMLGNPFANVGTWSLSER